MPTPAERPDEALSRLLALGLEGTVPTEADEADRAEGEWLREMLLTPLPIEVSGSESAETSVLEAVGRPVGELVVDSAAALPVLEAVKAHAESVVNRTAGPARKAATAVYYAAIAATWAFHGQSITRFTPEELARSLARLQRSAWVPAELTALFDEARRQCDADTPSRPEGRG